MRRSWRTLLIVALVGAGGCGKQEPQSLFTMAMPQDQSRLDLQWPAIKDETQAIHFRIPREDLDTSRLRGDKPGQIDWVFLDLPDLGYVELRQFPNNARMRRKRYAQWSTGCTMCVADGVVGGLQRFSKQWCQLDSEELRSKPADDPSPEGCALARSNAYLSNSMQQDQGERGTDIWCTAGHCEMDLQVQGRHVDITFPMRRLPEASAMADTIRARLSTYVVRPGMQ